MLKDRRCNHLPLQYWSYNINLSLDDWWWVDKYTQTFSLFFFWNINSYYITITEMYDILYEGYYTHMFCKRGWLARSRILHICKILVWIFFNWNVTISIRNWNIREEHIDFLQTNIFCNNMKIYFAWEFAYI